MSLIDRIAPNGCHTHPPAVHSTALRADTDTVRHDVWTPAGMDMFGAWHDAGWVELRSARQAGGAALCAGRDSQ